MGINFEDPIISNFMDNIPKELRCWSVCNTAKQLVDAQKTCEYVHKLTGAKCNAPVSDETGYKLEPDCSFPSVSLDRPRLCKRHVKMWATVTMSAELTWHEKYQCVGKVLVISREPFCVQNQPESYVLKHLSALHLFLCT